MLINFIINPNDLEEIQQTNYIIESIVKVIDNITSDLNLMKTKWNL